MRLLFLSFIFCIFFVVTVCSSAWCQQQQPVTGISASVGRKITEAANRKLRFTERRLAKSTDWMLKRLEKEENKIRKKVSKLDSSKAAQLFTQSEQLTIVTTRHIGTAECKVQQLAQHFPSIDELNVSLSFLQSAKSNPAIVAEQTRRFAELKEKLLSVQSELERTELLQQYITERRQLLSQQLGGLNVQRHFNKISRHAGTYTQLVQDYKNILNNPERLQQLVLQKLKRIPAFNDFLASNSALAGLLPGGGTFDPAQLAGTQTQMLSSQLVQNAVSTGGPNAQQMVTQQLQAAQGALQSVLNRVNGNGAQTTMPNYQPESLRSKTFFQRIEFGANLQFNRSNGMLPQASNWAAQAAYRFSKKGSLGIGAVYTMGMGSGFNNIRLTHNGAGLRSFADFKLKGSFFINGGFEQNYNSVFNRISELNNLNRWTGSALLGISKKYNVSKKLRGNLQLLYDFMHRNNVPNTQAFLFRFGYIF